MTDQASALPVLMLPDEIIGMKQACYLSGRDPRTLAKLIRKFSIGSQLCPRSPWQISAPGLVLAIHADFEGLENLRSGNREDERVKRAADHAYRVLFKTHKTIKGAISAL